MRIPSRLMPGYKPQPLGVAGWSVLLVSVCAGLYILWMHPWVTAMAVVAVVGLGVYEHTKEKWYFNQLMAQRHGESLCTFSREQTLTGIDTFIVRAVYEEIQFEIPLQKDFPLRWSDNLYSVLHVDGDNLEELIERIAQRTDRCITYTKLNPLYGKIHTVGDLIIFLNHQPKGYTDPNNQFEEN